MENQLKWEEESRRDVFKCRVFSIHESQCQSPNNKDTSIFVVIDSADWAIILPVLETEQGKAFVMVRQWRHGAQEMSLEFPGGVFETGESPTSAALRELEEETAYTARKITYLGKMSPNPAIMSNHTHFFLAEDLEKLPAQHLDKDEYVDVEITPINEVLSNMGKPPYIHALMGTAVALFMQKNTLAEEQKNTV
ncbi:MAG: NUDIX hydrolase [Treponema sp.]|jgi:8-oxo-dGTP pyrophosphatase MutT (NUDIX family)|nr:NUDIX hydrolase [Treponema sp.]